MKRLIGLGLLLLSSVSFSWTLSEDNKYVTGSTKLYSKGDYSMLYNDGSDDGNISKGMFKTGRKDFICMSVNGNVHANGVTNIREHNNMYTGTKIVDGTIYNVAFNKDMNFITYENKSIPVTPEEIDLFLSFKFKEVDTYDKQTMGN